MTPLDTSTDPNPGVRWSENHSRCCQAIDDSAQILRQLGRAFALTGNQEMARNLFVEANVLTTATEVLRENHGQAISRMVTEQWQNGNAIVQACLRRESVGGPS